MWSCIHSVVPGLQGLESNGPDGVEFMFHSRCYPDDWTKDSFGSLLDNVGGSQTEAYHKSSILYMHALSPFVPSNACVSFATTLMSWLSTAMRAPDVRVKVMYELSSIYLERSLEADLANVQGLSKFSRVALETWLFMTSIDDIPWPSIRPVYFLEKVMCKILSCDRLAASSAVLHSRFVDNSPVSIVRRCIDSKYRLKWLHEAEDCTSQCLLACLIQNDPVVFAPAVMKLLSSNSSPKALPGLIRDGLLDKALNLAFSNAKHTQASALVASILTDRAIRSLQASQCEIRTFDSITELLNHDDVLDQISASNCDRLAIAIQQVIDNFTRSPSSINPALEKSVLNFSLALCLRQASQNIEGLKQLSDAVLRYMLRAVPRYLMQCRSNDTSHSSLSVASIAMIGTQKLLGIREIFDSLSEYQILDVMKECIHFAMSETGSSLQLQTIRFVKALVKIFPRTPIDGNEMLADVNRLPEIVTFILSHKQCASILRGEKDGEVNLKTPLLELILDCLSRADCGHLDKSLWILVLSECFRAGMSPTDTLVRMILQTYAKQALTVRLYL